MVKNLSTIQETWVRSLGREAPLEKEMAIAPQPHQLLLQGAGRTEERGGEAERRGTPVPGLPPA